MRRNPIRESHPVKGKGRDNMVRLDKGLHAPSGGKTVLHGINRTKVAPLSERRAVRIQVSNVPVRNW